MNRSLTALLSLAAYLAAYLGLSPAATFAAPTFITASSSKETEIKLTDASKKSIVVSFLSPTPQHQMLSFEISGPSGTALTFGSAKSAPRSARDLASKLRKVYPGLLYPQSGSGVRSVRLNSSSSSESGGSNDSGGSGGSSDPFVCGCLTEKRIEELRQTLSQFGGASYSQQEICSIFGNSTSCPSANGSQTSSTAEVQSDQLPVTLSAFVQDDACDNKAPVAVLNLDLSRVKPANLADGSIRIKPTFSAFTDNKRVKLKRFGEGQYKSALLLAGPVRGRSFFAPLGTIGLTTWRGDFRARERSLKIADFVFYPPAGGSLWRIPLPVDLFTGGKGTFELRTDAKGYSVCATLERKDQFFNGYPRNTRGE